MGLRPPSGARCAGPLGACRPPLEASGTLAAPAGSRSRQAARGRYYQSPWGAIDRPPYPQESNARAVPGSPRRANPRAYRVAPEASVSVARQAGAGAPARASASTPTRSQGRRPRYIPSGRRRNDEQRVGRPSHTPSARIVYLSSRHLASQLVSALDAMGRRLPGVDRECRRGPLSTRVRPLFGHHPRPAGHALELRRVARAPQPPAPQSHRSTHPAAPEGSPASSAQERLVMG